MEGLVVRPERMRRNLEASHGLFFSQRLLLALVESGLARGDAYRLVQRHALQRAWDEELDFRELVRADDRDRGPGRPRRRSSTSAAYTRHVDAVFERLRALARRRTRFMPEAATHVGSGKVRELYALDDERLLLVASDRISTFDVVLPTEIPDKGRVLTGLSAFWFARTREHRARTTCSRCAPTGRSTECRELEMLPIECVVRGYLAGSGWKDYRATGAVCGHALPRGLRESDQLPGADLHAGDEGARRPRREHRPRAQAAELVGEERFDEVERVSLELYRFASEYARRARDHHRRHEVRVRARRATDGSCSATRRSRPDSSRFWPADEYAPGRRAAVLRQAVRARLLRAPRLGQDRAGARAPRATSSPARAPATSRRSSG